MREVNEFGLRKFKNMWKEQLSEDTGDFWVDYSIQRLENCNPFQFCKEAYSRYHPVILTGLLDQWPAMEKWQSEDYLINTLDDKPISVNLTLEGRADSIQSFSFGEEGKKDYFLYPAEVQMTLKEFFHLIHQYNPENEEESTPIVPYLSQQNDNLRREFHELLDDINMEFPLAEVFDNSTPEAINLWIGDERSVSSLHKDPFENFYFVIKGEKTFTLFPPTDVAYLPEKTYPTIRYEAEWMSPTEEETGNEGEIGKGYLFEENLKLKSLKLTRENCPSETISWIPIDPNDYFVSNDSTLVSENDWPDYKLCHPIVCTVKAGEVLYIPARWYHRVSQTQLTVAVNMWYDQRFDFR